MNAHDPAAQVLTALVRLEAEIAAAPAPAAWKRWDVADYEAAQAHGPFWSDVTAAASGDAERVRLGRARDALEKAGLLVCQRHEYSGRVNRLKLTAAGCEAAAQAARETAAAGAEGQRP